MTDVERARVAHQEVVAFALWYAHGRTSGALCVGAAEEVERWKALDEKAKAYWHVKASNLLRMVPKAWLGLSRGRP